MGVRANHFLERKTKFDRERWRMGFLDWRLFEGKQIHLLLGYSK